MMDQPEARDEQFPPSWGPKKPRRGWLWFIAGMASGAAIYAAFLR